jgi:peptidoglycan/LPS O-acetylase OafA/YrhL
MTTTRRYDLDWLRTLAVLLVLPFHALLVFVMNPNSVVYMKATVDCVLCDKIAGSIAVWQMQLLFVIAGMSSAFALARRSGRQYLAERVTRLLIPFLFGMVALLPPMTYITQRWHGKTLTLAQHYARFFTLSPDLTGVWGTWTPAHLWFILFLFLFSLIALPLFLLLRSPRSLAFRQSAAAFLSRPFALLLLGLLTALAAATEIMGAQNPVYYIVVFICGYLLATDDRYAAAITRDWPVYLALGIVLEAMRQSGTLYAPDGSLADTLGFFARYLNSWVWVLALLGLGRRFLNRPTRALAYLSEASFPFYILHMPVLTLVTYFLVRIDAAVSLKYALIVLASFAVTFLAYEIARRIAPLRFLLGIKTHPAPLAPARPQAVSQASSSAP